MSSVLNLSLRAGDSVYINGAVLRVDRKVTLELLNDAKFILSNHVIKVEDAKTPLRQMYYIIQSMLMVPETAGQARELYRGSMVALSRAFSNVEVLTGLYEISRCIDDDRLFEALKKLRKMFSLEERILSGEALGDDRAFCAANAI